jgi:MoaA/NifB/PqqE/SkfB family radical SAM enzyme
MNNGRPSLIVAWETTRQCPLACRHCRASATDRAPDGELSTQEGERLIDAIADFAAGAVVILTGGEPLSRPDILELASRASRRGLRVALATCGAFLTHGLARDLKNAGVERIT